MITNREWLSRLSNKELEEWLSDEVYDDEYEHDCMFDEPCVGRQDIIYKLRDDKMSKMVCHCNVKENAELIHKILDADLLNAKCIDVVEVKHGKWEWASSTSDRTPCEMEYYCSECNHKVITHLHEPWDNFCPNCGADMRKADWWN